MINVTNRVKYLICHSQCWYWQFSLKSLISHPIPMAQGKNYILEKSAGPAPPPLWPPALEGAVSGEYCFAAGVFGLCWPWPWFLPSRYLMASSIPPWPRSPLGTCASFCPGREFRQIKVLVFPTSFPFLFLSKSTYGLKSQTAQAPFLVQPLASCVNFDDFPKLFFSFLSDERIRVETCLHRAVVRVHLD